MTTRSKKTSDDQALATTEPAGGLEPVPDYLKDAPTEGTDHMTSDDVLMPRLTIAQGLSPQIDIDKPEYIEGLKKGDLFNSLTGENYGRGPLEFIVIYSDRVRYVEFNPMDEGGGVVDLNVPPDDPRTEWRNDPQTGERIPPVATAFRDYVIMLLPSREVVALSFKSTGLKVARRLNGLIKQRMKPTIYLGKYSLRSVTQTNAKGTFHNFQIANAGWVPEDLYPIVQKLHQSFKAKGPINVAREPGDEAEDFPPADAAGEM